MLNAVGLQNVGVRAFVAEKLPVLRNSIQPSSPSLRLYLEDYVEVLRVLEDADGLAGYELNISCPNVKRGGIQFGSDPAASLRLLEPPEKPPQATLWVKLSLLLQTLDLLPGLRKSREQMPDRGNTYPAMASTTDGKVAVGNQTGGLSGQQSNRLLSGWSGNEEGRQDTNLRARRRRDGRRRA